jgi:hypothetical protein
MLEKVKGYIPLNFELIINPVNWIIVFLMIALAGVGLALITSSISDGNNQVEE